MKNRRFVLVIMDSTGAWVRRVGVSRRLVDAAVVISGLTLLLAILITVHGLTRRPDAVEAAGLDLHEYNCDDFGMCLVIGTKGWSVGLSGNLGSMARVVVEDAGDFTVVRVLSRRRAGNEEAAEDDYSAAILSQIEVRLQVAGGP